MTDSRPSGSTTAGPDITPPTQLLASCKFPDDFGGTYTGYQKGCRCSDCTEAATEYQREYRAARHGKMRLKMYQQAEGRALRALRDRHPDDYRKLYEVELERVGLTSLPRARRGSVTGRPA